MSLQTPQRTRPATARMAPPPSKQHKMADTGHRLHILLLIALGVISLFAARLVDLQAVQGPELAAKALNQRIVTNDIPATRGTITDVKGTPLAVSIAVRDITADQTLVEDPAATATVLAPILGMQVAELQPMLTGTRRYIILRKATPPEVWRNIQRWKADENNDAKVLQAIFSERRMIRDYPNGELAAPIIGFTNYEDQGAVGLESGLNNLLVGKPGSVTYEQAAGGTEIPTSDVQQVDPVKGTDVKLTIDADLQWAAQQAVADRVKTSASDFGTAIVMEVGTGRILAMASAPGFDANRPDKGANQSDWSNRPVTWAMEPGSTAKLMSIAAVLDQGAMKPNTHVVVPGGLTRGGQAFKDSHEHGTLYLTLTGVLAESSNIGTILATEKIGGRKLYEYLKGFGVGEPTGLDFPGQSTGYVPNPKEWSDTSFPTLSFGQGMSMTALQVADMVATIGNNGIPVVPRLIDSFTGPDGTVTSTDAVQKPRVISAATARTMRRMMQMVVGEGGTAANASVPGYLVGGKTGTAERYDDDCNCYRGYTASFVGLAPADRPRLVVGAWFDNPKAGYYGSEVAAPVVQKLMTQALASQNVPPTGGKPVKLPLTFG